MTEQIRADVEIRFSAAEEFKSILSSLSVRPYNPVGTLVSELVVQADVQRWTIKDGGNDTSIIQHASGRRSVWDHSSKTCYEFDEATPSVMGTPAKDVTLSVSTKDDATLVDLQMTDDAWGSFRHQFEFSSRTDLKPFAAAVFQILQGGPDFYAGSGIPFEQLIAHGCLVAARSYLGGNSEPAMEMRLTNVDVGRTTASAFVPPKSFRVVKVRIPVLKPSAVKTPAAASGPSASTAAPDETDELSRRTRHKPRTAESPAPTPDCIGSTRLAPMSVTIHQSLLDHVASLLNQLVPLLGVGTITTLPVSLSPTNLATFTLPWLSELTGLDPLAAGSGLGVLLTDPRLTSTQSGGPSGGVGLLDMLAVWLLENPNPLGNLQGAAGVGASALDSLLLGWGILEPMRSQLVTDLLASNGDITKITDLDELITLVQAFENAVLSTVTANFPIGPSSGDWGPTDPLSNQEVPLINWSLSNIGASINFGTIPPGSFVTTFAIGSDGDVNATIALPNTTLTATIGCSLTWEGAIALAAAAVVVIGVGGVLGLAFPPLFAILFPGFATSIVALTALLAFILENMTTLTAVTTAATATVNIQFQESTDTPPFQLVPLVTLTGNTGTTTVSNTWTAPNVIADLFDSLVVAIGNATNSWIGVLLTQGAAGLQNALTSAGFVFPSGPAGIGAVGGTTVSIASTILELSAWATPDTGSIAPEAVPFFTQPYLTQVDTTGNNMVNLIEQHLVLEQNLNPQPTNPPPPLFPVPQIDVAMYLGLGLSQNALNCYLFQSWLNGEFEYDTESDPSGLAPVLAALPAEAFQDLVDAGTQPGYMHVWCATPPRVEVSMDGIIFGTPANGNRPLVFFFDDCRACFEPLPPTPNLSTATGVDNTKWELSFNAKTTGTLTLQPPFGFTFALDGDANSVQPIDAATWEFINPFAALNPTIMAQLPQGSLQTGAMLAFQQLIAPMSAGGIVAPAAPIAVSMNAVPGSSSVSTNFALMQQSLVSPAPPANSDNNFALLMLAQRRTLYLLTALDWIGTQFVDGEGAPLINGIVYHTPPGSLSLGTFPDSLPTRPQLGPVFREEVLSLFGSSLNQYIVPTPGFSAIVLNNMTTQTYDVYYSVGTAVVSDPIYFDIIPTNFSFSISFTDLDGGDENGQSVFLYLWLYGQGPNSGSGSPPAPYCPFPPTVILSSGPSQSLSIT